MLRAVNLRAQHRGTVVVLSVVLPPVQMEEHSKSAVWQDELRFCVMVPVVLH